MVEQKVTTQGIKMSKGVEPIFIIKQKIVVLPKIEPTITKGVPMVIKVKYSEPRFN